MSSGDQKEAEPLKCPQVKPKQVSIGKTTSKQRTVHPPKSHPVKFPLVKPKHKAVSPPKHQQPKLPQLRPQKAVLRLTKYRPPAAVAAAAAASGTHRVLQHQIIKAVQYLKADDFKQVSEVSKQLSCSIYKISLYQ